MLIRLLLPANHFVAPYSTTLLVNLHRTSFRFDVKFWQMDHAFAKFASAIFLLIYYYVCAEAAKVVQFPRPVSYIT